ncbi:PD-(D/E)XK nuclease family protein [Patescibacteria group bacterium]|nr:PD-(D/E)XK nuclease family protein [Patescibacteria group bacterium]
MTKDKYSAVWVSHSSIKDFLKCPRAYYLKNVYRDPKTGHKIKIVSPPLALGQAVHEVVESLSILPVDKRFSNSIIAKFAKIWDRFSGKQGGFPNFDVEAKYRERGQRMIRRLVQNPGPLANLAVKIKMNLPYFWLSSEDNIILCGKIDWIEYLPEIEQIHIIDFKTSSKDESAESMQLPIYCLLAKNCQDRPITKASYWYLARNDSPTEITLPDLKETHDKVLEIAKQIKIARKLERFKCPSENGCPACRPYEAIIHDNAEFVSVDEFDRDVYVIDETIYEDKEGSVIL